MKSIGVIPARYGSTRFEGKPLKNILGKPMIEWVYRRALKAKLDKVVVATDDIRIYDVVVNFGGEAVMTSANHQTGTDRIAEVAEKYKDYEIIINIQGDEPLIRSEMIDSLIKPFIEDENIVMGTLKHKITDEEEVFNPNVVKVICDKEDFALYFSRSPIPYKRIDNKIMYYRHIGIYAYRRNFLEKYTEMVQTPLEKTESLEQLRVLENGYKIKVIETEFEVKGVDTKEDLINIEKYIIDNHITI